ncbi:MAG TPA: lamin tail domain-containing protein, partial [Patescibacteria group bacterium]|nr:lamin tail domain-containing protein [Patescibacteria group bacterium]
MRKTNIILAQLFFYVSFFLYTEIAYAQTLPSILLSEVQIEGIDDDGKTIGDDEFIELYNPSAQTVSLAGLKLCRKTSGGGASQIKSFSDSDTILGNDYFLFAHSDGKFATLADAKTKSSPLAK